MSKPVLRDEIAKRNLELTREAVRTGEYGEPFLDLDVDGFRAFRDGRCPLPPFPEEDETAQLMLRGLEGQEVLLLAGGGGQQSAVYALCGARVTVLDLTPEQLDRDRLVADHYGYEVTTLLGDMRDLSGLSDARFARVCQPISSLYVPDLGEVNRGVARVLEDGGLYDCSYTYPILYMAEARGWDGEAYVLRFDQPRRSGPVLETEGDGRLNYDTGAFHGEFHHTMPDIVNGLVEAGLDLVRFLDVPATQRLPPLPKLVPGSPEHEQSVLPFGVRIVSRRGSGP